MEKDAKQKFSEAALVALKVFLESKEEEENGNFSYDLPF
jgi:hypothetical protein